MKANYPEEFLAASMTLDMSNTDKLAQFAAEARRHGIEVKPPCVNTSDVDFLAEPATSAPDGERGRGAIRYSLAALRNIGASAVSTIVAERTAKGRYKTLDDFATRLNPKAMNKRALETLAAAGALDALEKNRALVFGNVDQLLSEAGQIADDHSIGQGSLLDQMTTSPAGAARAVLKLRAAQAWTPMERLSHVFGAVGFYLSGHPLDEYDRILPKLGVKSYAELEALTERGAAEGRLAGVVISARERKSQRGNKFAFAMFSDPTGQFEAVIFSDTLAQCRDLLEPGTPVLLAVAAERDGDTVKMRVEGLEALDKAAAGVQRGLKLVLDRRLIAAGPGHVAVLKSHLKQPGQGEVRLVLPLDDRGREIELIIPGRYDVSPTRAGILSTTPGVAEVLEI
jgi:DNA polymerase-3 subunit alpha